jgi:hypothetical protein
VVKRIFCSSLWLDSWVGGMLNILHLFDAGWRFGGLNSHNALYIWYLGQSQLKSGYSAGTYLIWIWLITGQRWLWVWKSWPLIKGVIIGETTNDGFVSFVSFILDILLKSCRIVTWCETAGFGRFVVMWQWPAMLSDIHQFAHSKSDTHAFFPHPILHLGKLGLQCSLAQ